MDKLSAVVLSFGFQANVFYNGEFCGSNLFSGEDPVGHLHLVRRGDLCIEHDQGVSLEITTPTLLFYPRPFKHRLVVPPTSQAQLLCATVSFKQAHRNPFAMSLPDVMQIPLDAIEGLDPALHLLFDEAARSEIGKRLVLDRLCDILVVHVIRYALGTGVIKRGILAGLDDTRIAATLAAIHEAPARNWCIEDMAAIACMSRSKFAKYFHELVGMTPAEYLTDWRMGLAENLLAEKKSVKTTALAVGYSSQPAFSKAFTARYGMSPKEWLKQSH